MRRTSTDEIPNLVNVLRGQMALVGPRPALPAHLDYFDIHGHPRFDVLPGSPAGPRSRAAPTSPGPNGSSLDEWYVTHRSPSLDLRILARTILPVLKARASRLE